MEKVLPFHYNYVMSILYSKFVNFETLCDEENNDRQCIELSRIHLKPLILSKCRRAYNLQRMVCFPKFHNLHFEYILITFWFSATVCVNYFSYRDN